MSTEQTTTTTRTKQLRIPSYIRNPENDDDIVEIINEGNRLQLQNAADIKANLSKWIQFYNYLTNDLYGPFRGYTNINVDQNRKAKWAQHKIYEITKLITKAIPDSKPKAALSVKESLAKHFYYTFATAMEGYEELKRLQKAEKKRARENDAEMANLLSQTETDDLCFQYGSAREQLRTFSRQVGNTAMGAGGAAPTIVSPTKRARHYHSDEDEGTSSTSSGDEQGSNSFVEDCSTPTTQATVQDQASTRGRGSSRVHAAVIDIDNNHVTDNLNPRRMTMNERRMTNPMIHDAMRYQQQHPNATLLAHHNGPVLRQRGAAAQGTVDRRNRDLISYIDGSTTRVNQLMNGIEVARRNRESSTNNRMQEIMNLCNLSAQHANILGEDRTATANAYARNIFDDVINSINQRHNSGEGNNN